MTGRRQRWLCWHFWRWHRHPHYDGTRQCERCCLDEAIRDAMGPS